MKTIAICNHKGGVGKTALSMAIAEGLHRKGKRTLLVDLDQQMNATQQAKIDTTDEVTVYDLLTSFDYTAKDGIKHFDGGDIIPGDVLVSNAESDMAKLDTRLTMLADAMEGIDDDYDYAIIDCPPSLGLVTRNAMVAADELIVPVIPNRSSLKGFTNIQKCVNSVRRNKRLNPNLRIAGIVVNMFDGRTSLSRGVVNELPSIARAANTKMFHTIIRKCEAVNKAQSANVSIFDYDPNCNAVADFTDFVNEYSLKEGDIMALPNVTPEQRAKALEKAAQVRKARKELKENIKSGKTDPASVLKTRKDDPLVSKMKVKEFLQAIPGIGGAKADKIMHDVDIPGNRRLGGLGIRQAEALLEYLS